MATISGFRVEGTEGKGQEIQHGRDHKSTGTMNLKIINC